MGLLLTFVVGWVIAIVLWGASIMKFFDAFLIGMVPVLLVATFMIALPYLQGSRR